MRPEEIRSGEIGRPIRVIDVPEPVPVPREVPEEPEEAPREPQRPEREPVPA